MINWNNIDSVFLDMDGTLLDLNFDNHFWLEFVPLRFAEARGITVEEAKRCLMPKFRSMEGRLEWYCLDYWSAELALDVVALKAEIAGLIAVLPHVTDFLDAVRGTGRRLVLVTNAHPKSLGLKMEKTCLHHFFDAIFCAHDFGIPKEDPRFWGNLKEREDFDVGATLLVDDSVPVLRSARVYGIANLVAARKPDSMGPERTISEFLTIQDFRELMPPIR